MHLANFGIIFILSLISMVSAQADGPRVSAPIATKATPTQTSNSTAVTVSPTAHVGSASRRKVGSGLSSIGVAFVAVYVAMA